VLQADALQLAAARLVAGCGIHFDLERLRVGSKRGHDRIE